MAEKELDEKELAELVNIAQRACVFNNGRYDLEYMETFLRLIWDLEKFPNDERKRLAAQYAELSDEDREYLSDRICNRTHPARFHLTESDAQKLDNARKDLSFHERAQLSAVWGARDGIAWLDIGKVFDAQITIDDESSPEREDRPYAHVFFSDGYRRRVETIDIFATVEQNAASIGHPAILAAIEHWQQAIYSKHVHSLPNREDDNWITKYWRERFTTRRFRIAEANIKVIGKKLIAGAHANAVSPKAGLAFNVQELNLTDTGLLHHVWAGFRKWEIPDLENGVSVERLQSRIHDLAANLAANKHDLSPFTVCRFLTEPAENGGYRYFDANKRPTWAMFKNAFVAWYFGKDVGTIKNCPAEARKNPVNTNLLTKSFYLPLQRRFMQMLSNLIKTPLVFARGPERIRETGGYVHIEEAIMKKDSVT